MAIKNKMKEKRGEWKEWQDEQPIEDEVINLDNITIKTDYKNDRIKLLKGVSEIELKISDLDAIIEVLAEED